MRNGCLGHKLAWDLRAWSKRDASNRVISLIGANGVIFLIGANGSLIGTNGMISLIGANGVARNEIESSDDVLCGPCTDMLGEWMWSRNVICG
ncbi:hypothetical protein Pyn_04999 [Prunus yedoensis var. nudiflora]|uniref:Uncharacterized protein n=1 Tax=Prunus yedoensis var. nudiflora TaxID=2094558 RepID=A0A314UJ83_PRUYE|nr:hypothetical protein Pyn_04999 [Prunus yedoensis var. nudiflora]